MSDKKWMIRSVKNDTLVEELRSTLKVDPIVSRLLVQRGITTYHEAESFFNPDLTSLHDPFLMLGMKEAVKLLSDAIQSGKKILLYGDYDVDGTTAVAVMFNALSEVSEGLSYYIPDRYTEGYGLSDQGVDYAVQEGVNLMILLDCGVKSVDKITRLKENGIEVIVCDHHTPGEVLPPCCVLDPKQVGCNYPYKELSGCGVGFKLLQALTMNGLLSENHLFEQLDLLAISIGADIVEVLGENRILAFHGLKSLNQTPRKAFQFMIGQSGKSFPLTLSDVVFTIAPRINAAGRLRSGRFAVEMMIHPEEDEIKRLVSEIENDNLERRMIDAEITKEALSIIHQNNLEDARTTVLHGTTWHKGVVGIVASRLIESFYRPTIVFSGDGEILTGSARSIPGINIYDMIQSCEEHLIQFGGHAFAAGLTIKREQLQSFRDAFENIIATSYQQQHFVEQIEIDSEITFSALFDKGENRLQIPRFKRIIDRFEPFGPGNMKPVFLSKNLYSTEARLLKEEHLKLKVTQPPHDLVMDAIGFRMSDKMDFVASGLPFDMVYTLENNTWRDRTTLQFMVKDIRESE